MTDTKILIIDDDSNVTEVLKSYFENEGYDIKVATDGMEGLNYFKIFSPDLVLLDVMLPKKDGWQVCREIREISSKPIIFVTAKNDAFDTVLGLELGADDFVTKPFDIKVLSAILVELDMDAFKPLKSRTNRFVRVPEYPMNEYDISFLVDSSVKWSEIYSAVLPKKSDDNLLREVLFVDEYKGKQIPEGKKSITLRLVIGSGEKTLTGPEIETVANSARKKLAKTFGADVRTV